MLELFTEERQKRYWSKVDIRGIEDCWPWLASYTTRGYGQFGFKNKMFNSHRISWMLFHNKEISKDMYVRHKCGESLCQNPRHLYLTYKFSGRVFSDSQRKKIGDALRGRKRSKEVGEKISKALKGRSLSESHRAKMPKFQSGEYHPYYGKSFSKEHREKISAALMGKSHNRHTEESKRKIGIASRNNWLEGKHSNQKQGRGKSGIRPDLGVFLRSTWEANYARILNFQGIKWEYEAKRFDTPYGTYCPDFYLVDYDSYIEVKGWEFDKSQKAKRDWLDSQGLSLNIIDADTYSELSKLYRDKLSLWET